MKRTMGGEDFMYPIRFENLYYEKVWGGRDFEKFRDNLPDGSIGESWDIACHDNGTGIVQNGEFKGLSFNELINKFNDKLLGAKVSSERFPLLVKLINSKEKLSVQVHPGDEYAAKYEGDSGKTEAWYVVDAKPGASIIVGTKDCTKEEFELAIKKSEVEKFLNKIEVKKGDCFLISNGLIHAICEGVIIAEIQQNSDVTYRVYDYGRPRELHIKKSLDVIDFNLKCDNLNGAEESFNGYKKSTLCKTDYFIIEKITIESDFHTSSDLEHFDILTCVEGEGTISGSSFNEKINLGDSLLIPASLGSYKVQGNLTILKSYPVIK